METNSGNILKQFIQGGDTEMAFTPEEPKVPAAIGWIKVYITDNVSPETDTIEYKVEVLL